MSYTFEELKHKRIADLRTIAEGLDHEGLQGHTQMHKEPLVLALCAALGIEAHEHHEVKGIDKATIKSQIRELKGKRDGAIEGHDHKELKRIRREIHGLKRSLHKATV